MLSVSFCCLCVYVCELERERERTTTLNACVCVAEDVVKQELCKVKYLDNDLELLRNAIEDLYYFEFVIGKSLS